MTNTPTPTHGEETLAFDICMRLFIAVVIAERPGIGKAYIAELDAMLEQRLPTPAVHAAVKRWRDHFAEAIS